MELQEYLSSLGAEGGQKETLSFTLDQAKAWKKLSESQLPEPSLWIVKMVQAAVRGSASEIDIKLGRNRVEVRFDSPETPHADRLLEILMSGELSEDPFLLHLATGLRAGIAGEGTSFLMQTEGPDGKVVVALVGEDSFLHENPHELSPTRSFTLVLRRSYRLLRLKKALDRSVSQLLRGTAEEHMEILTRCWASPIPVRVDGRLIDRRYDSPLMFRGTISCWQARSQKRSALLPPVNMYLRHFLPEPGRPTLPLIPFEQGGKKKKTLSNGDEVFVKKPVFLNERFLEWSYEGQAAGRILVSPLGKGRESSIYFIHDGALVKRVPMNLIPPIKVLGMTVPVGKAGGDCVVLPVDFEDLDLSQFSISEAETRRTKILDWLQVEALEASQLTLELIDDFFPISASERVSKGALALGVSATIPVTVSFGAPGLAAYAFYQGFFSIGSLVFRANRKSVLKAAAQKMEKAWNKNSLSQLEQPPID